MSLFEPPPQAPKAIEAGPPVEEECTYAGDALVYDPVEDAKIVDWRVLVFRALGFDALRAGALALRRDIDREDVQRMVGAGATPEQVALILL